jgi:hypothetical protein
MITLKYKDMTQAVTFQNYTDAINAIIHTIHKTEIENLYSRLKEYIYSCRTIRLNMQNSEKKYIHIHSDGDKNKPIMDVTFTFEGESTYRKIIDIMFSQIKTEMARAILENNNSILSELIFSMESFVDNCKKAKMNIDAPNWKKEAELKKSIESTKKDMPKPVNIEWTIIDGKRVGIDDMKKSRVLS